MGSCVCSLGEDGGLSDGATKDAAGDGGGADAAVRMTLTGSVQRPDGTAQEMSGEFVADLEISTCTPGGLALLSEPVACMYPGVAVQLFAGDQSFGTDIIPDEGFYRGGHNFEVNVIFGSRQYTAGRHGGFVELDMRQQELSTTGAFDFSVRASVEIPSGDITGGMPPCGFAPNDFTPGDFTVAVSGVCPP